MPGRPFLLLILFLLVMYSLSQRLVVVIAYTNIQICILTKKFIFLFSPGLSIASAGVWFDLIKLYIQTNKLSLMAYTQAQLDILEAAIAEGTTRVRYADKTVEYRSLDEMIRIRGMMREELGLSNGGGGRRYGEFSKGLYK